jgi:16S rRNA (guanine1207-N2)-methyltransferase
VVPESSTLPHTIILFQPREKELLDMCLHFLAANAHPDANVWLVGENTSGIKSAGKALEKHFKSVTKVDSARHCSLYRARDAEAVEPFDLARYHQKWLLGNPGAEQRMVSLPGAFAHGRLDRGTELLLQAIARNPADWKVDASVLDFGCGIGVIGLYLLAREPSLKMTLLDSSALALESAKLSLALNGLEATVLASDGLAGLDDRFDLIVTNPPFHRGVATDLAVARRFIQDAGDRLRKQGRIILVCNRHLPYEPWLCESFGDVQTLEGNKEYKVLRASRPKGRQG